MKLDKDIIKRFVELGFTEEEISALDTLDKVYNQNDLYKKIGKYNKGVVGVDIRPVKINIENIEKRMETDKSITPKDIISSYAEDTSILYGGATSTSKDFFQSMANDLTYYGIYCTAEQLYEMYNTNLEDYSHIEYILSWFRKYESDLLGSHSNALQEQAWYYIDMALDILSNYSGIDLETGEILDDNEDNEEE